MKFLLVFCALAAFTNSARAEGPAHGNFDWKKLIGVYRFGECTCVNQPLWSDEPDHMYVEISNAADWSHGGNGDYLEMNLLNDNPSMIVPQWSFELIDKGPQDRQDNTGFVDGSSESYSTVDGVYGVLTWNRPYNIGWSKLQLRMDGAGNVSYEMQQMTDSDSGAREERCALRKQQ